MPSPTSPWTRWLGALPAVGLATACAFRSAPEWPRILAEVRARHPDVPQVGVEKLGEELGRPRLERPLLLDARGEAEFAVSHLEGALWTPDEAAALAALAGADPAGAAAGAEREREVIVYCSVGIRSSDLAHALRERGFTHVSNLEGGIFAWANAGLPTYRGEERVAEVHPFDERWGSLLTPERRAP